MYGSYVKTQKLFIRLNGVVLGFQLYWDEVEPANPLGSKKGEQKVGVFYMEFDESSSYF